LQLIDKNYREKRIIKDQPIKEISIPDDNHKVKRLAPSFYIVQLISIADGETIMELKQKYNLPKLNMIHYKVKGKDRYALLQGHYPTKTSAQRAIDAYPKALSRLKPWIRKISTIHRIIY
jgi:septal ring-binding cell division protein DamX